MNAQLAKPTRTWAIIAMVTGVFLLLTGFVAALGYLGLPLAFGDDIFSAQLGQMAAMFLGLVIGTLSLVHGLGSLRGKVSRVFQLPPAYIFWISFALVLGIGNLLLPLATIRTWLFPPFFLLGAALPTFAVIAWAGRRLGWPISWRQSALILAIGSTLSVAIALVLEIGLPWIAYLLITPLDFVSELLLDTASGYDLLGRLALSPAVILFLIGIALQAPIPEEFAKVLGVIFFGRYRIRTERQAFMLGLVAGAGFAILENMVYQGLYAGWHGWTWGGLTLLRGIGSVLHPLATGIVALGWFRARERGWNYLLRAYVIAVGLHTLWNGGFWAFIYLTGLDYYSGFEASVSFYGLSTRILLVAFLILLSAALWWLLYRLTAGLGAENEPVVAPSDISQRALAAWAFACTLIIVPLGAALGPAWQELQQFIMPGG